MNIFKGYVPTKNKKCLMSFRNSAPEDLQTYDQVRRLKEYAGILSEDVILIDIDDAEQSEILFKIVEEKELICRVYQTTRGKHFIFCNLDGSGQFLLDTCKTHCTLAIGLTADIKVGCKNSYSILKYNGEERKIIYDKLDDEEYQSVPKYLLPVKNNLKFLTMEEGSGRNQALFNYILTLQSANFNVDECRECIRIINDYVMQNPLEEGEIETILRDEAFQKPVFFNKRGVFLFDKFAVYLKNTAHVIKINDELNIYKDGIYVKGSKRIENAMIHYIPNLNKAKRMEVLSYLDALMISNTPVSDARYICFKNGVFDIETDQLHDLSPDYVLQNKISFDYDPEAYSELCDRTLNKLSCQDPVIRQLLEEVIGYVMYRRNELRKAFILTGDKSNGKSTYLDMIKTMLGDENTTALDLKELSDKFKTAEAVSKLAVIGDDIGDEFIPNPSIFKKLAAGDRINTERKGKDPFDFNSYAKLLFSANNIPRIKDKSGAVIDRLIIVPFNARFSVDDPDFDPYIKYKLRSQESIKYMIRIGIQGLKRVLENKRFTVSEKVQKELQEYEENNNPLMVFLKEDPKIEDEATNKLYRKYSEFCIMNGYQQISHIEFSKQIKKRCNMEIVNRTIRGKKYRVFVPREESNG